MNSQIEHNKKQASLSACKTNDKVIIHSINAGRNAVNNINKMGISIGDEVRIKTKSPIRGPIIVSRNGTDIAIGNRLAQKILVIKTEGE